jgi:hypothetical protein
MVSFVIIDAGIQIRLWARRENSGLILKNPKKIFFDGHH